MSAIRASALIAFAACCFGSISILTIVGTKAGASLPNLLFWRYALGAAALALLAAARGRRAHGEPRPTAAQAARLVALGGAGQAAVTALSLAGITVMIGVPGAVAGRDAWPGVLLALASAVVYALYIPLVGRISAAAGPIVGSVCITTGAALILGAWAVVDGTLTARIPPAAWGAAVTLALVCTVLAFVAFLAGLGVLGPVRTAIVSTVEPFWTAVLGAAVLAQPLTLPTFAGGALIAGAVLLLQLPPRGTPSAPSAS